MEKKLKKRLLILKEHYKQKINYYKFENNSTAIIV